MGHWEQLELTPSHISYLTLSFFLINYVLFEKFIRNRLHLSEPPIALVLGIIVGPQVLGWVTPNFCGANGCHGEISMPGDSEVGGWGWGDDVVQEATRVIVGIQVFAVGVELPAYYMGKHWKSLAMMLGPVMTVGWLVSATLVMLIFKTSFTIALVVAACLTPTDPVLAASILSNSQFSERVPKRIKELLSVETGCNDGTSFPFLYIGLFLLTKSSVGEAIKEWFLITILWQCAFSIVVGVSIGTAFNRILRFSVKHEYVARSGFLTFYLLLALLSVGIGSILGADDFLVSFGCGYGFSRDGWFSEETAETKLPQIIDLMLNSAMFVYLGAIIPWQNFAPQELQPYVTIPRLLAFVVLVLLLRRIPVIMALYRFIPHIHTWREAFFCGHFGPMGLGGLFLAIEARAILETGTAEPLPKPDIGEPPWTPREKALQIVWPIVCFTVMSSTLVHGLSVLVLSIVGHFRRPKDKRAALLAGETDPLVGMNHDDEDSEEGYGAVDHSQTS
ncbi:hypothetical protein AMS68_000130 [Peltaster fructicola]|uniref:Cation/H+ exchanger transmembrane domain-containing protein n=1 Tax=Peltaster fructicola TaxID=286661 RepID=A0A6H0XIQ9_9PEZI|nr:hypothetical protein AMS68_000130 [Peltaster fructicola]